MAKVIDGRTYARELKERAEAYVTRLEDEVHVKPGLATVMVGDDYSARTYERRLRRRAAELGCAYRCEKLPAKAQQDDVVARIGQLNTDPRISGILLLRPVPAHIDESAIYRELDPLKDVESMHPVNAGLFAQGRPRHVPSTPASIMHLLDRYLLDTDRDPETFLQGKRVVIVGRSANVGQPVTMLALARGATVIACDEHTDAAGHLAEYTREADVLIVAAGVAGLITADHVSADTIVIDVGINPVVDPETGRTTMVGDVDFPAVRKVVEAISPVPGGVGPITDVCLVRNTIAAAELNARTRAAEVSSEWTVLTEPHH